MNVYVTLIFKFISKLYHTSPNKKLEKMRPLIVQIKKKQTEFIPVNKFLIERVKENSFHMTLNVLCDNS